MCCRRRRSASCAGSCRRASCGKRLATEPRDCIQIDRHGDGQRRHPFELPFKPRRSALMPAAGLRWRPRRHSRRPRRDAAAAGRVTTFECRGDHRRGRAGVADRESARPRPWPRPRRRCSARPPRRDRAPIAWHRTGRGHRARTAPSTSIAETAPVDQSGGVARSGAAGSTGRGGWPSVRVRAALGSGSVTVTLRAPCGHRPPRRDRRAEGPARGRRVLSESRASGPHRDQEAAVSRRAAREGRARAQADGPHAQERPGSARQDPRSRDAPAATVGAHGGGRRARRPRAGARARSRMPIALRELSGDASRGAVGVRGPGGVGAAVRGLTSASRVSWWLAPSPCRRRQSCSRAGRGVRSRAVPRHAVISRADQGVARAIPEARRALDAR